MPLTLSNYSGDGVTANLLDIDITLPDTGTSIAVSGKVQSMGQSIQTVSAVVNLSIPGSGTNYYILEANTTTGAVTVMLSTTSFAAITLDPNNVEIFRISYPSTANPDEALDAATSTTPDTW